MISAELREALAKEQSLGTIGPGDLSSHIEHAEAFAGVLRECRLADAVRILDLGSGAGLPGLVLAELLPRAQLVLLEGRQLRAERLARTITRLGLSDRVTVEARRAETAGRMPSLRGSFDVVVARGFGRPAVAAECAAPFLRVGGILVVSEPPDPEATILRWPAAGCQQVGLRLQATVRDPRSFVILTADMACDDRYPRRTGVPEKRPLF